MLPYTLQNNANYSIIGTISRSFVLDSHFSTTQHQLISILASVKTNDLIRVAIKGWRGEPKRPRKTNSSCHTESPFQAKLHHNYCNFIGLSNPSPVLRVNQKTTSDNENHDVFKITSHSFDLNGYSVSNFYLISPRLSRCRTCPLAGGGALLLDFIRNIVDQLFIEQIRFV